MLHIIPIFRRRNSYFKRETDQKNQERRTMSDRTTLSYWKDRTKVPDARAVDDELKKPNSVLEVRKDRPTFKTNSSAVWGSKEQRFYEQVFTKKGKYIKFAQCTKCKKCVTNRDGNTSALGKHVCWKDQLKKIKSEAAKKKAGAGAGGRTLNDEDSKKHVREVKKLLKEGAVTMVVKDGDSFRTPSHEGFLEFARNWMEAGEKFGFVPSLSELKDLTPSHQTVSRGVTERYKELIAPFREQLRQLMKGLCPAISLSADFWSDPHLKHHYIGVMVTQLSPSKEKLIEWCLALQCWEELHEEKVDNEDDESESESESEEADVSFLFEGEPQLDDGMFDDDYGPSGSESDSDSEYEEPNHNRKRKRRGSARNDDDGPPRKRRRVESSNSNSSSRSDKDENEQIEEEEEEFEIHKTKATAENIAANWDKLMINNGLEDILESIYVYNTHDEGSNLKKWNKLCAEEDDDQRITRCRHKGINCILHKLCTIQSTVIKACGADPKQSGAAEPAKKKKREPQWKKLKSYKALQRKQKGGFKELTWLIREIRKFVSSIKKRGLNNADHFEPLLKLMVDTRWNTLVRMLLSVGKNHKAVCRMLERLDGKGKFKAADFKTLRDNLSMIKQLVRFWLPWVKVYEDLQQSKTPTLHLVLENMALLYDHVVMGLEADSKLIKHMRAVTKEVFEKKVLEDLELVHWVATLLCPGTKKAKYFRNFYGSVNKRNLALEWLRIRLQEVEAAQNAADDSDEEADEADEEEEGDDDDVEQQQTPELENEVEDEWGERTFQKATQRAPVADKPSPRRRAGNRNKELDEYLKLKHLDDKKLKVWKLNPLKFWNTELAKEQFPTLTLIARSVFVISPSSASAERLFSWAKSILTDKRQKLKTSTVKMLAFLHYLAAVAKEEEDETKTDE